MSGKAMEVAIPRGTALREMLRSSESEGHCWVAASLLHQEEALAEPKWESGQRYSAICISN
jgi:hypothetical protein